MTEIENRIKLESGELLDNFETGIGLRSTLAIISDRHVRYGLALRGSVTISRMSAAQLSLFFLLTSTFILKRFLIADSTYADFLMNLIFGEQF